MLAPPGELAPPPRGNPGSATGDIEIKEVTNKTGVSVARQKELMSSKKMLDYRIKHTQSESHY